MIALLGVRTTAPVKLFGELCAGSFSTSAASTSDEDCVRSTAAFVLFVDVYARREQVQKASSARQPEESRESCIENRSITLQNAFHTSLRSSDTFETKNQTSRQKPKRRRCAHNWAASEPHRSNKYATIRPEAPSSRFSRATAEFSPKSTQHQGLPDPAHRTGTHHARR